MCLYLTSASMQSPRPAAAAPIANQHNRQAPTSTSTNLDKQQGSTSMTKRGKEVSDSAMMPSDPDNASIPNLFSAGAEEGSGGGGGGGGDDAASSSSPKLVLLWNKRAVEVILPRSQILNRALYYILLCYGELFDWEWLQIQFVPHAFKAQYNVKIFVRDPAKRPSYYETDNVEGPDKDKKLTSPVRAAGQMARLHRVAFKKAAVKVRAERPDQWKRLLDSLRKPGSKLKEFVHLHSLIVEIEAESTSGEAPALSVPSSVVQPQAAAGALAADAGDDLMEVNMEMKMPALENFGESVDGDISNEGVGQVAAV
jgi:hypothetical protein